MKGNGTGVIKKIMLWFSLFGSPLFLMIFVLFVVVLFSLGLFEGTSSSSGGISSSSGDKECGFTISTTIKFKVCLDHAWTTSWGENGADSYIFLS